MQRAEMLRLANTVLAEPEYEGFALKRLVWAHGPGWVAYIRDPEGQEHVMILSPEKLKDGLQEEAQG